MNKKNSEFRIQNPELRVAGGGADSSNSAQNAEPKPGLCFILNSEFWILNSSPWILNSSSRGSFHGR